MTIPMPEPVAWVRRHPDGALTAEFLEDAVISPVRKQSGAWLSMVTTTQAEAYADARVAESQQWQPIETAPKDGTAILIGNERGAWIAKYAPVYPSGYRPENPWFSLMLNHDHMRKGKPFGPTHWMPLPAPPLPGPVEP